MKLIRKIGTRISKSGRIESWAVFWCAHCKQEMEKRIDAGKKAESCGCFINVKHGESHTKLYHVWLGIKGRIFNIKNKIYEYYGGRGIIMNLEWANDYIKFKDWALSNVYTEGLQIHRLNDGNYEPSSCKWVTQKDNMRDTRTNVIKDIEMANEIRSLHATGNYTLQELGDKYNTHYSNIFYIVNDKTWKN